MSEHENKSPARRSYPVGAKALLGAAVIAGFGGALIGETVLHNGPALADPVRVEGVQSVGFADVVDKVQPAVVSVRVRSMVENTQLQGQDGFPFNFRELPEGSPFERFFREFRGTPNDNNQQRPQRRQMSQGSGFFISEDGYLVTNNHVVDNADEVTVVLDDGTELKGDIIGKDQRTDLALVKVKADRKFTYVKFSEKPVRVGEWVVAIGNPFGLGGSVTAGIVSGTGRRIGSGPYDDFIQIDAAVNRGNSGGPAFNLNGEVVGVNTAIFSPSGGNVGIAFAIPASTARSIVLDLRNDGSVVRGWLGVQIQPVTAEIAKGLGLEKAGGALVTEPQANGPAVAAGIKTGDAILAVNGEAVSDSADLARRIAAYAPNTEVTINLWREGAKRDVKVKLGRLPETQARADTNTSRPAAPGRQTTLSELGIAVSPVTSGEGVLVSKVEPTSAAADRGLRQGDVILSIGGTTVSKPEDVEKALASVKSGGRDTVLLRVRSGDNTRFVALPVTRG